jgi:hypothetical protein
MVDTVVPKTRMDWLTAAYHNTPGGQTRTLTQPVATRSAFLPIAEAREMRRKVDLGRSWESGRGAPGILALLYTVALLKLDINTLK